MVSELFSSIANWYMAHMNYGTITLLMAIESSFIPFPSEIVIPPAAWKAAQGDLNVYLVFLFSTLGSLIGAFFNYYIALFVGRKIIYRLADTRLANLMLINPGSIEKAEEYFRKHGKISTFIGRLVPAVRQLISIPAGFCKMKISDFILFTMLGSMIWNAILTALGYFLYSQKELLELYYSELSIAFLVLGFAVVGYLVYKAFAYKKTSKSQEKL